MSFTPQTPSSQPKNNTRNTVVVAILFIFLIGAIMFFAGAKQGEAPKNTQEKKNNSDKIVSNNGMHWHADLTVTILGEIQEIPIDIGLEGAHKPIHTHEDKKIHMEFNGVVKESDITLGQFFKSWGKTFNKDCIFDKCNGSEGRVVMMVNLKENSEFEKYVMKDNDRIDILFEEVMSNSTSTTIDTENNQTPQVKEIIVIGNDFNFNPPNIPVKAGEPVKIIFKNEGEETHNLVIEGLNKKTSTIGGGQVDVLEFTAPSSGIYEFICSVDSHRIKGMTGKIIVEQ